MKFTYGANRRGRHEWFRFGKIEPRGPTSSTYPASSAQASMAVMCTAAGCPMARYVCGGPCKSLWSLCGCGVVDCCRSGTKRFDVTATHGKRCNSQSRCEGSSTAVVLEKHKCICAAACIRMLKSISKREGSNVSCDLQEIEIDQINSPACEKCATGGANNAMLTMRVPRA